MRSNLLIILLFLVTNAYGQDIPQDTAVRIIVSEAANQGLEGMICVGEVLRHRGSTKGFYGYRWNDLRHQPQSVWNMAERAWNMSEFTNYTHGADHFENVHTFGKPWWAKYCIKTFQYKDHIFYKEERARLNSN